MTHDLLRAQQSRFLGSRSLRVDRWGLSQQPRSGERSCRPPCCTALNIGHSAEPATAPSESIAASQARLERLKAERAERERKLSATLVIRAIHAMERVTMAKLRPRA